MVPQGHERQPSILWCSCAEICQFRCQIVLENFKLDASCPQDAPG
uniref:Uncharacterized protein n=1 Tax=Arundo donax TaxID=35708 RepID=A0A0A9CHB1_ARUDO